MIPKSSFYYLYDVSESDWFSKHFDFLLISCFSNAFFVHVSFEVAAFQSESCNLTGHFFDFVRVDSSQYY